MKKIDKETILKIPGLRADGKTNQEIAVILGLKQRTLDYWISRLKEAGYDLPLSHRGRKKIEL